MMVTREIRMSRDDAKPRSLAALILWPIAVALIAAGLLGGFAGHNQAALDNAAAPPPGRVGPLAALRSASLATTSCPLPSRSARHASLHHERQHVWNKLGSIGGCRVVS